MQRTHSNPIATFLRGATSGAFSTALMMGIYGGVTALAQMTGWFSGVGFIAQFAWPTFLPVAAVAITAFAVFGGIMAISRGHREAKEAHHHERRQAHATEHGMAPVLTPTISADRTDHVQQQQQRNWTDRVGSSNRDNVSEILARGGMSDKDRATAIMQERERDLAAAARQR